MRVFDDVLADPVAYRHAVLARPFGPVGFADGTVFFGIQVAEDPTLPAWITEQFPHLTPTLSFFRQSPVGQVEPNYVHTDHDMGDWTAILYLNPTPVPGDGTAFWRHKVTGAVASVARDDVSQLEEQLAWRDLAQWELAALVEAKCGRVLLFEADRFHSRAIHANYGYGDDARLVQVVFGTGQLEEE